MKYKSLAVALLIAIPTIGADEAHQPSKAPIDKVLPRPGENFLVDGHPAFLIPSRVSADSSPHPWVWYAPTLPGLPASEEGWMFDRFLAAGISIAGIDVGESYGNPAGRALFTRLYQTMTQTRGYSSRPVLLGRSRGGLMVLSWAEDHPTWVGGVAGIYPVCNLNSYPGLETSARAYGMNLEMFRLHVQEFNPIDRLASLANSGISIFAIHGDVDTLVPLEANSGLLQQRYRALNGSMELVVARGQGHNMWEGFFQCQAFVDFVLTHSAPASPPAGNKLKL
jgi:pimeloyl-ACP methyl ester carboxylesterase